MKKTLLISVLVLMTVCGTTVLAQTETTDGVQINTDIALLRRDLRTEKKKIIAMNVSLTESEATKFWPVYDQYTAEMAKHNDDFYALVKDYVAKQKTITDAEAAAVLKRWAEIQVETVQTRQKYIPLVEKTIPPKKAALFFQVDRRLWALLDLQVASLLPLVTQ
jgi:hypothetical protein